jgi:hypothetical protein
MNKAKGQELLYSLTLCNLAYQYGLTAASLGMPMGLVVYLDGINSVPPVDVQGYVILNRDDNTAYVVFRGCEVKFADWWDETLSRFSKLDFDSHILKVHSGFLHAYKSIDAQLLRFFQFNNKHIDTIVFTGHGIGGALAEIAAVFYHSRHRNNDKTVKVHTFGAPRVGDAGFCDFFKDGVDEHWRVYTEGDPAPTYPAHKVQDPPYLHPAGPTLDLKPLNFYSDSAMSYSTKSTKAGDVSGEFTTWDGVDFEEHLRYNYLQRLQGVTEQILR